MRGGRRKGRREEEGNRWARVVGCQGRSLYLGSGPREVVKGEGHGFRYSRPRHLDSCKKRARGERILEDLERRRREKE